MNKKIVKTILITQGQDKILKEASRLLALSEAEIIRRLIEKFTNKI